MPCCGKGKMSPRRSVEAPVAGQASAVRRISAPVPTATFELDGDAALTVIGPLTGRRYHFAGRGERVPVDGRDAAAVSGVPSLRRVASGRSRGAGAPRPE